MAKLKRVAKFDVKKAEGVKSALADLEKFCASGIPEGEATLTLEFDAPSLRVTRERKGDEVEADEALDRA